MVDIADSLGHDCKWLQRWRGRNQYEDTRREVTDVELDELVRADDRGECMMKSCFAADYIIATRERLRSSIHRIDPEGFEVRKRRRLQQV